MLSKTESGKHPAEVILESESAKGEIPKAKFWVLNCLEKYGEWECRKRTSGWRMGHQRPP